MDALLGATAAGLVAHGLAEPLMRRPEARGTARTEFDHGTTTLVSVLGIGGVALALCARALGLELGAAPTGGSAWALVGALFLGAGLRFWSMAVLGRFFTRTLRVSEGHRLVQSGPYRLLRHPGYLANLVAYTAAASLVAGSWLFGAVVLLLLGAAYGYRIHHEERMLVATLGEDYRTYRARTYRLVPWVY